MRMPVPLVALIPLLLLPACASQPPPADPPRNPPPPPQYEPREAGMSPGTWQLEDGMTREEAEAAGLATPEDERANKPEGGATGE
jgi:hypothetical protein